MDNQNENLTNETPVETPATETPTDETPVTETPMIETDGNATELIGSPPDNGRPDLMPEDQFTMGAFRPDVLTNGEPPKKKNALPKILIGVAAAAAVAAVVFVIFGQSAMNMVSPENYLQSAFEKTTENMKENSLGLPDMARYADKTIGLDAEVGLDYLDDTTFGYEAAAAVGSSFSAGLKLDGAGKKALLDLSVNAGGLQLNDNKLFIAKDTIALSVPMLYSAHTYLTLDPLTFTEDWNASEFATMGQLSADFDLPQYIDYLFGDFGETPETLSDEEEILAMLETLATDMAIADGEDQRTTLAGDEVTLRKFALTYSADSVNAFFDQFADYYERQFTSYFAMLPPTEATAASQAQIGQFVETLRGTTLAGDMIVDFYINDKQLVTKIEMQETDFVVEDTTMTMSFVADMCGEKNILDEIDADFAFAMAGDAIGIHLKRSATNENNVVNDRVTAALSAAGSEMGALDYSFNWNKAASTGSNMSVSIAAGAMGMPKQPILNLEGNLLDDGGEISLADGVLNIGEGESQLLSLSISGAIREISPEDVAFNEEDSVPLFDLTLMDLLSGLIPLMQ